MSKKTLLTPEGLIDLQAELKHLKEVRRVEVAEKLKEAISFGDLSENSEYAEARDDQAQLELKIIELEDILKNYELVDTKKESKKHKIVIGNTVIIAATNDKDDKETYKLVGSTESDIFDGKISNESPIGKALIGKSVGDIVHWKSGAGQSEYEVIEIK